MKELLGLTPQPRIVTACCGAGWGLTATLMATPGASEYLVGSYLPYDADETSAFIGFRPAKFVSGETAIHLATEAFMRATLRASTEDRPIGLGMTASIASLREHRGKHEAYLSTVSSDGCTVAHLNLVKAIGNDARALDDAACRGTANALIHDAVLHGAPPLALQFHDEARAAWLSRPLFSPRGRARPTDITPDAILFPGAFNPLHDVHRHIADAVFRQTGRPVVYNITADSPHKPALTFQEMARRAAQIRQDSAVMFTEGDPLYIDKARRFPGRAFIIGVDALDRMLDPKWGPAIEPMLQEFESLGTKFLVAPRIIGGVAVTLPDVAWRLPARYAHSTILFESIGVEPNALSSSQLREQVAKR